VENRIRAKRGVATVAAGLALAALAGCGGGGGAGGTVTSTAASGGGKAASPSTCAALNDMAAATTTLDGLDPTTATANDIQAATNQLRRANSTLTTTNLDLAQEAALNIRLAVRNLQSSYQVVKMQGYTVPRQLATLKPQLVSLDRALTAARRSAKCAAATS
jgi:hypothetical protein